MAAFDTEVAGVRPETIRVKYTIMDLIVHHPLVGEVIVVDNNPLKGPLDDKGKQLPNELETLLRKTGKGRYVPMPTPQGTSPPRNRIFEEARFNRVAVIDGHVKLHNGFFEHLNQFYIEHGNNCLDLLHGTMVNEDGSPHATHMNDQWRAQMWGTWGIAWQHPAGFMFSCREYKNKVHYVSLNEPGQEQHWLHHNQKQLLPELVWPCHEFKLKAIGCTNPTEPFIVPGHGMGFFACLRHAWLPFHPDARGFGGEEMTTGIRFRKAGRNCWTVPQAKWWHDYPKPHPNNSVPYRLMLWDRIRNYLLEFKRLGLDIGIIRKHFNWEVFNECEFQDLLAGKHWPADVKAGDGTVMSQRPRPADMPPDGVLSL
jgi:hypothetical protein